MIYRCEGGRLGVLLTLLCKLGGKGNWTTMGCETEHARNGEVTCYCNHLTNFAVLVVSK